MFAIDMMQVLMFAFGVVLMPWNAGYPLVISGNPANVLAGIVLIAGVYGAAAFVVIKAIQRLSERWI